MERGFEGLVFHRPLHRSLPASAIRRGGFKLLLKYASPRQPAEKQLFDLSSDVGEQNDLSAEMPEKAAELERLLLEYLRSAGANMPPQWLLWLRPALDVSRRVRAGSRGARLGNV